MIVLFLSLIISIFIYKNSLFFIMSLLIIRFLVLSYIALYRYLSFLTVFILIIVYVGAIIVLIGYICAISPNLILEPDYSFFYLYLLVVSLFYIFNKLNFTLIDLTSTTIVDYFYRFQGMFIFLILVLMLFVTLLIVTSQYSVPKGPFRSINF